VVCPLRIDSFPVQENNLRVLLRSIQPLSGASSLYQDPPSDCCQTAFRRDTNSHLLGRFSPDSSSEGHTEQDFLLCAESFVQPGFHSETGEVLSGSTCLLVLLGAVPDKTCMSVALPEEQINRIQGACQEMLESQSTSLGGLSSLLGRMSHAARTGLWIAPLYYRALQCQQAVLHHQFGWRPRCPIYLSKSSRRT